MNTYLHWSGIVVNVVALGAAVVFLVMAVAVFLSQWVDVITIAPDQRRRGFIDTSKPWAVPAVLIHPPFLKHGLVVQAISDREFENLWGTIPMPYSTKNGPAMWPNRQNLCITGDAEPVRHFAHQIEAAAAESGKVVVNIESGDADAAIARATRRRPVLVFAYTSGWTPSTSARLKAAEVDHGCVVVLVNDTGDRKALHTRFDASGLSAGRLYDFARTGRLLEVTVRDGATQVQDNGTYYRVNGATPVGIVGDNSLDGDTNG